MKSYAHSEAKCVVTFSRNGRKVGDVDLDKFDIDKLLEAIDIVARRTFESGKEDIANEAKDVLSVHGRERTDEQTQLAVLYGEAIGMSELTPGPERTFLSFLDTKHMDDQTKIKNGGSWWQIYEYGSPSSMARVGGSTQYRFVEIHDPKAGKHAEGFMQKTDDPSKGHPGVVPFHVTAKLKDNLRSQILNGVFAQQVFHYAAFEIGRTAK